MEQIKSFEQYRLLTAEARHLPDLCTNWYFLPDVARGKIAAGILFFEEVSGGLLLLEREAGFFRLYFFLDAKAHPGHIELPAPGVAELVYQNQMTSTQETQAALLQEMGFSLGRESGRMTCQGDQALDGNCESVAAASCKEDVSAISRLIRSTFDPRYAFISSEEQTLLDLQAGKIFIIRDKDALSGVLYSDVSKGVASIRQLVVSEAFRNRGLGGQLLSFYHKTYREKVKSFAHWVDLKNSAAIRFYQKYGYTLDGRHANEYIIP